MNDMYPDDKEKLDYARKVMQRKARDHARTPMQWDAGPNAGFCKEDVQPWMRVNDDFKAVNAEVQRQQSKPDQLSVLQFWKRGLTNRRENKDVFIYGDFKLLDQDHDCIFAYKRFSDSRAFVVVLNFSNKEVKWTLPSDASVKNWVAGNYTAGSPDKPASGELTLRAWEGLLGMVPTTVHL